MATYKKISGISHSNVAKITGISASQIAKIGGSTAPYRAYYEWADTEIFNHYTFASGSTSSPDGGNGHWNAYGGWLRRITSGGGEYDSTIVPYLVSIPDMGINTMRIADVGHQGDSNDDFVECATGSQDPLGNNGLVCHSTTGVTFSNGNMVDGDHVIMWKFKHDVKNDTWRNITSVLNCTSNVLTAYRKEVTYANSSYGYTSVADTKVEANIKWQLTWSSATNTWTINDDSDDFYNQAANAAVSWQTTGSFVGKQIGDNEIRNATVTDHWVWKIDIKKL